MNRLPEIIGLTLWLVIFVALAVREEVFPKRLPAQILRYPRYPAVLGVGGPFVSGWLIYEMLCASDWEKMKLLYLLLGIPFMTLFGITGTWMFFLTLNRRIDIKEDCIVYRNVLRRTRTIRFSEITGIEHREPRSGNKNRGRYFNPSKWEDWVIELIGPKKISSYCIYIGKRSIQVDSFLRNYEGSAERILKAMKKQGIQCPVTTKKTWFA